MNIFKGEYSPSSICAKIPAFVILLTAHDIRIPCGGLQTKYSKTTVKITQFPAIFPLENVIILTEPRFTYPSIQHFPSKLSLKICSRICAIFVPTYFIGTDNFLEIIFLIYRDILPATARELDLD